MSQAGFGLLQPARLQSAARWRDFGRVQKVFDAEAEVEVPNLLEAADLLISSRFHKGFVR